MLGAAIIILTLVIAFSEKPHLFKRPYKPEKLIIVSLLFICALFSALKEWSNDSQQDRSAKTIDSLNTRSKVLTSIIDTLRKENKEDTRYFVQKLDSSKESTIKLLADYGLTVDTLTNTIKTLDKSILKEPLPTLAIIFAKYSTLSNEEVIDYETVALNADVHLIDYRYIFVNIDGIKFIGDPIVVLGTSSNYTTVLPRDLPNEKSIFISRIEGVSQNFALAIEYIYKSKRNVVQTPVRKIYLVNRQKRNVLETTNEEHYSVSLYLRKKNIWTEFYNL